MPLAQAFGINPHDPAILAHNAEVRAVMEAYAADKPIRVPLLPGEWAGQYGFYAEEIDLDHVTYYTDPEVMLTVQLEAARRRRELPICDMILGEAPASWPITVDFWPAVPAAWCGCELYYRRDSVLAYFGRHLSRDACDALEMPDPRTGGILAQVNAFWQKLDARTQGMTYLGRPVGPVTPGVGHTGVFSLALDLRGAELMQDFYDAPEFVHRFLRKIADWCDALETAWSDIIPLGTYNVSDHGIDMLSPAMYEEFFAPIMYDIAAKRGKGMMGDLHHCGRGAHLFPTFRRLYNIASISNLTYPLVDIAKVRRELGEDVRIVALVEDGIIQQGPPAYIREVVKELLLSAKGRGRFALNMGDMLPGTPLEHRIAFYQAVREFGRYD